MNKQFFVLLVLACFLLPKGALANVHCGKEWVTFVGTNLSEFIPPSERIRQRITIRKIRIDILIVNFGDDGMAPAGLLYLKEDEAPYQIDTIDSDDIVLCLD